MKSNDSLKGSGSDIFLEDDCTEEESKIQKKYWEVRTKFLEDEQERKATERREIKKKIGWCRKFKTEAMKEIKTNE